MLEINSTNVQRQQKYEKIPIFLKSRTFGPLHYHIGCRKKKTSVSFMCLRACIFSADSTGDWGRKFSCEANPAREYSHDANRDRSLPQIQTLGDFPQNRQ